MKAEYIDIPYGQQPLMGRKAATALQMYRSQSLFWPLEARSEEVHVEDIAYGLARQIRFSGQTRDVCTVAWHSVALSLVVPEHLRKWALMHDASECYLSDVCRPIKVLPTFKDFLVHEANLTAVIADAFGLDGDVVPEELEHYDKLMGTVELYHQQGEIGRAKLRALGDDPLHDTTRPEFNTWRHLVNIQPSIEASERLWLAEYETLFGQ